MLKTCNLVLLVCSSCAVRHCAVRVSWLEADQAQSTDSGSSQAAPLSHCLGKWHKMFSNPKRHLFPTYKDAQVTTWFKNMCCKDNPQRSAKTGQENLLWRTLINLDVKHEDSRKKCTEVTNQKSVMKTFYTDVCLEKVGHPGCLGANLCALENEQCSCEGKVYFGRKWNSARGKSGAANSFEELKADTHTEIKTATQPITIACSDSAFQIKKDGFAKICYCEPPQPQAQAAVDSSARGTVTEAHQMGPQADTDDFAHGINVEQECTPVGNFDGTLKRCMKAWCANWVRTIPKVNVDAFCCNGYPGGMTAKGEQSTMLMILQKFINDRGSEMIDKHGSEFTVTEGGAPCHYPKSKGGVMVGSHSYSNQSYGTILVPLYKMVCNARVGEGKVNTPKREYNKVCCTDEDKKKGYC